MGYLKATTPTSAGFAQAFDSSSFAIEAQEEKKYQRQLNLRKQDKLEQSMMKYNPKGMYKNHLPGYQKAMQAYTTYVMENNEALMNPSANLEIHQQKLDMESQIKNIVAGSLQMNQEIGKAQPMVLGNERYISGKNTDYMNQIDEYIPSVEELLRGDAFIQVMQGLDRNKLVDEPALIAKASQLVMKEGMLTGFYETGDVKSETVSKSIDEEAFNSLTEKQWNLQNPDAQDLRDEYGSLENMRESWRNQMVEEKVTSYKNERIRKDETKTASDAKVDASFTAIPDAYTFSAGTTTVLDDEVWATYDDKDKEKAQARTTKGKDGGVPMITKSRQYRLGQSGTYAVNTESGGGTSIVTDIDRAYNLSTGTNEELPKAINKMKVLQIAMYNVVNDDAVVELKRKGQGPLVIPAGHPIPKYSEEDFAMSKKEFKSIIDNKTKSTELAKVYASSNPLELLEHMSEEEIMELIKREGSTNKMLLVDYTMIHGDLMGVFDERTKTPGAYNQQRALHLNQKLY